MTTNSDQVPDPDNAKANDVADPPSADQSVASFWDQSQIQEVIRHAGATGRSPEEFFNKKWKDKFIHKIPVEETPADKAKPRQE